MLHRLFGILMISFLVAATVQAGATGFSFTGEEAAFGYPQVNQPLVADFAAPVGTFRILTPGNIMYSDNDPVSGAGCDPTTFHTMILDSSSFTADMRLEFPMPAAGAVVVFDKIQFGQEYVGPRYGAEWGIYSAITHRYETMAQFGPSGQFLVFGSPVPIGGGQFLSYANLWTNNCASGVDHHITVEAFHNLPGGTVTVDVTTHGTNGQSYRNLGPFQMLPEVRAEGIRGQFVRAPGGLLRTYADGMVCVANAPITLPGGGDTETGTRGR